MAKKNDVEKMAFAEILLNRTLAYQAAVAVHTLKDLLDLDVQELRLVVEPTREDTPGKYCVTCTIESLGLPQPHSVVVEVQPDKSVKRASPRKKK
jgi:hypothetical protein